MSRQGSVGNAQNLTNNYAKDEIESGGGPLHFPADDELKKTDTMKQTIIDARAASEKEHQMSFLQGVRLYPKAIGWSVLISTCIAMEGYDVCLVNNFYGFPPFNKKYGVLTADGSYQIPARWQAGLSNGAQCGEIIGLFINGWVSEKFGYRYVCKCSKFGDTVYITDARLDCYDVPRSCCRIHGYLLHCSRCQHALGGRDSVRCTMGKPAILHHPYTTSAVDLE